MAFALDPNQPQNQPGQPGQPGQTAPVTTSSAPGAGPAAPGTQSTSAPSSQAPTQPFVNLQQYLTANAPQIQQEGQQLSDQLTAGAAKAQGDITTAKTAFDSSVQGGYAAPNPDLVSQVATNPTAVASDPGKAKDFQAQLNNSYKGPQNFETAPGTVALNKEIEQAASAANLVNSPQGLQTYFQQVEPNPTPGMTTLDSVLLGGDPTAMGMVTNAAKPYKDVTQYLTDTTNAENQSVTDAQAAAQGASTAARGAVNSAASDLTSQVQAALTAAQSKYGQNGTFQEIQQAINNGQPLSADQAAVIGIDPAAYQAQLSLAKQISTLYNNFSPNLSSYFTPGDIISTPPSAANVANADQYAEAAALASLAGGETPNLPIDPSQKALAGTFSTSAKSPALDLSSASSAIKNQFVQDDSNVVNAFFGGGVRADPFSSWPAQVQQAMIRLKASGVMNNVAPVGFGSNPGVY